MTDKPRVVSYPAGVRCDIEIGAELPKTPVGKLSKKELYQEEERKRAAAGAT